MFIKLYNKHAILTIVLWCDMSGLTLYPFLFKHSYVTFKEDIAKPFIHIILIDLLPWCKSSSCLTCLLSSLLFVNVCICSSVRPLWAAPVRVPGPLQKVLFSVRTLRELSLLQASQDSWKECFWAGERSVKKCLIVLMNSDQTLLIMQFLFKVVSSSIKVSLESLKHKGKKKYS